MHLLFNIVGRIRKYSGVETTGDVVPTLDKHPMFPSFNKFGIEHNFPLSMKDFSIAMGQQNIRRFLAVCPRCKKITESIRQLPSKGQYIEQGYLCHKGENALSENTPYDYRDWCLVCNAGISNRFQKTGKVAKVSPGRKMSDA